MNINRHNYEEFFLLYVDNELSAADRRAVDVFVRDNPDLKVELQMLQQTVVNTDDIVLDKKDWLYMEEDIAALQENLILYADDELSPADKVSVEALLKTDKAALAEFTILQQTKLQPDTSVIFADKKLLYRTAGGRVVGFKWWRAAAAAVLLGFGIWGAVSVYKNNLTGPAGSGELVKDNKSNATQEKNSTPVNTTDAAKSEVEQNVTDDNIAQTVKHKPAPEQNNDINKQTVETYIDKNKSAIQQAQEKNNIVKEVNTDAVRYQKPSNNLPKPYFENINNNTGNEIAAADVIPEKHNGGKVSGNSTAVVRSNPKENISNGIVANSGNNNIEQPAAMLVSNNKTANGNENARYLDVDDKEKRTALGGFIRKAKRMIERTTNVKSGEGIKVAGFEIALK